MCSNVETDASIYALCSAQSTSISVFPCYETHLVCVNLLYTTFESRSWAHRPLDTVMSMLERHRLQWPDHDTGAEKSESGPIPPSCLCHLTAMPIIFKVSDCSPASTSDARLALDRYTMCETVDQIVERQFAYSAVLCVSFHAVRKA